MINFQIESVQNISNQLLNNGFDISSLNPSPNGYYLFTLVHNNKAQALSFLESVGYQYAEDYII